ncbi:hypothetical protein GUJ93_ZPchr0012g19656 [Zizania palustris]|uniref:Nodulin-like domain-containing protein n=1 Tax=Zizania palustris TaxID=103762 RepID=A0A8J5WMV5_ZIZPA|nr:hypothetical protein GUJ93_ZPchr0012g19656 [Zizania palustris]
MRGAVAVKAGSRPPWVGLGAAVWLQVAGGASSTFALYSHALKVALGADQRRLALLGVACDVGENLGLLPGVLCNRLHPALLLLIGAAACLVGYGSVWFTVSASGPVLPYWLIWFSLCLAANSGAWLGTAVLVTNMRNFPLSRGAVAGILKGVLLGVYLVVATILDHFITLTDALNYVLLVIMALLLFVPLTVPLKMTLFPSNRRKGQSDSSECSSSADHEHTEPLLPSSSASNLSNIDDDDATDIDILLAEGEGAVKQKRRRPKRGEDFRFREALLKADFWLLFAVYFIGVGSGVTVLNNLAQVGIAAGAVNTTISLSLFSFGNFFGRLGGGAVSEYLVRSRTLPRTALITCTQVVMHFGKIFNFISLGNPLGALLFNSLAGIYINALKQEANNVMTEIAAFVC